MSTTTSSPSVGSTLAGGIQDVSAILPLIGTEQCEKHVGSALTGGYLYAAAAPLSIFGSLGIVKSGMVILVSSISISVPKISISFHGLRSSVEYHGQQKWFGGRLLKDAGMELCGEVAPLIGMQGQRFRAETRMIEILEEKHIDDPQNVSINWKLRKWNFMLIVWTLFGAILSLTPYIALLLGPESWRPSGVNLRWLYPALRIIGSCVAAIACQSILQLRMISLTKNRILFMEIDQKVFNGTVKGKGWLKDSKLLWDQNLPSEQCLQSLEQELCSSGLEVKTGEDRAIQVPKDNLPLSTASSVEKPSHTSIPIEVPQSTPSLVPLATRLGFSIADFYGLQKKQFPTPTRDAAFMVLSWIMLAVSLPATVAGYIGCFTLVSAVSGNGPLVWVGLEAALSVLRIVVWASNPSFDEETEITVGIKLTSAQPIVTSHDYNPHIAILDHEERKPFTLVPEREFLERITPYTGPLDRFQKPENITLYFTLTTDYGKDHISDHISRTAIPTPLPPALTHVPPDSPELVDIYRVPPNPEHRCLFITAFDFSMQVGVYNPITRKPEATIQSTRSTAQPWRMADDDLFNSLGHYYRYVMGSLNKRDINTLVATLPWKWDLSPLPVPAPVIDHTRDENPVPGQLTPILTPDNLIYVNSGYGHHLKTKLIARWSEWIVMDMQHIRADLRLDCLEALQDPTCKIAVWELTELDAQLVWGWARRELVHLMLSVELEDILREKMESCTSVVNETQQDEKLMVWIRAEFESGRQKRMAQEKEDAKQRMEKAMRDARDQAYEENRPWHKIRDQLDCLHPRWPRVIEFIQTQWSAGINNERDELMCSAEELRDMIRRCSVDIQTPVWTGDYIQDFFIRFHRKVSHKHWITQHEYEEQAMRATIEKIRSFRVTADLTIRNELKEVYEYPEPDEHATSKFASVSSYSPSGRTVYSTMAYDTSDCCNERDLHDVIAKKATVSVINVPSIFVEAIPPNDHLLFMHGNWHEGIKEPAFVQRNRDRWWAQHMTKNSSLFFFTPEFLHGDSCSADNKTIARIFIFLISPSPVQIGVLHRKAYHGDLSIFVQEIVQENSVQLGETSNVPSTFQLYHFEPFELQAGRHELVLGSKIKRDGYSSLYRVRDIFVEIKSNPTDDAASLESSRVGEVESEDDSSNLKEEMDVPLGSDSAHQTSESE